MENKDLLKSPLFLIIAAVILILILYFIMSPYQICKRETDIQNKYCIVNTNW